jgi:hypothetical protein
MDFRCGPGLLKDALKEEVVAGFADAGGMDLMKTGANDAADGIGCMVQLALETPLVLAVRVGTVHSALDTRLVYHLYVVNEEGIAAAASQYPTLG